MKKTTALLSSILTLTVLLSIPVCAAEAEYGNEWVYDDAQVISSETEEYIKNLNENVFACYTNKPQLAFIIINDLPYDIEKYKLDMFNKFGVGTAEENCGMLFVFAINDREYALEIGDGFEKGTLLRKDLETDFISEDMKNSLRAGDYDSVVRQVAQHLEGLMTDEENGVYEEREAEKAAEEAEREAELAVKAAELAELEAKIEESLRNIGLALCVLCPAVGLVVLIVHLVKKNIRKKWIHELCQQNYKYLRMANTDEEKFAKYFKYICSETSYSHRAEMESEFLPVLYDYYITHQKRALKQTAPRKENLSLYEERLIHVNSFEAFEKCRLVALNQITYEVDAEEDQKEENKKKSAELVEVFFKENEHRIVNKAIANDVKQQLHKSCISNDHRVVTPDTLERLFVEAINDLGFQWEFDRFCEENKDKIDAQDFDRQRLYASVIATDNFRNYRADGTHYDRSWMIPLLMMHMAQKRQQRIERERREAEHRERRRREEAARRATESIRSNSSSFGSGFGGGHSSGGGFKGGW